MASRLELQTMLEKLLGSRNVYFQPPASVRMKYPAIVYTSKKPDVKHANNALYKCMNSYDVTLIDEDPDSCVALKLLQLPYCSWDSSFKSENLNHTTFTLYF